MASELSEAVSLPFLSVNRLATLPRIDCSSGPLNHFSSKGEGRKFLHTGCTGRIQVQREVQATVEPGSYHYQSSSAGIAGLHHSSVCSFCLPLWPTCCVSAPASLSLSAPSPALCRTVSCSTLHLLVASACLPIFFHAAKGIHIRAFSHSLSASLRFSLFSAVILPLLTRLSPQLQYRTLCQMVKEDEFRHRDRESSLHRKAMRLSSCK